MTLREVLDALRMIWRPALLGGLIAVLPGVLVGVLRPKSYVARASFVAEQTKLPNLSSGLGALAAQFGLDIPGEAGRSPQFYSELLGTSDMLRSLLDSEVLVAPTHSSNVRRLLIGTDDTSRTGTDRALRKLRKRISAGADARTSVVTLSVRASTPQIAERIASILINQTKHFNITTRQLQARERRQFLEGRVADASQTLRNSEQGLLLFYERNRRLSESPSLAFQESRMKRAIDLQQELYTTLSKELEMARIQEINDTPTITIVDPPFAPSRPSGPTIPVLGALFFVLGLSVTAGWLLATKKGGSPNVAPSMAGSS
ncbi:MAG TPA: hypothetical protein VLV45_05380 [Gemmatimonadales bacterium]|nr:hypothetical protein [Gemmatimonadales bacterium]